MGIILCLIAVAVLLIAAMFAVHRHNRNHLKSLTPEQREAHDAEWRRVRGDW